MSSMTVKRRIFQILEPASRGDVVSRVVDALLLFLILLDIVCFVLGSIEGLAAEPMGMDGLTWAGFFVFVETFVLVAFTLEYVLRLWSAGSIPRWSGVHGRWAYARQPMSLVDLAAILPLLGYVSAIPVFGVLFPPEFTIFRTFRLLRVGKLARYSRSLRTMLRALKETRRELAVIGVAALVVLLVASSLAWNVEKDAQPESFSSIPQSMWWAAVTMSTLGYGDVTPVTVYGKVIASFLAFLGIALFALPAGLLGASFVEEMRTEEERRKLRRKREAERLHRKHDRIHMGLERDLLLTCPHCRQPFRESESAITAPAPPTQD
jgi:voltage-gated potassium channel